jgi:Holliday junction resolvasome RuvABC endonuclease subunit
MSIYDSLKKKPVVRTLGIDCSTKSLAYACFEGETPLYCGEVFFDGANVFKRLNDARAKTQMILDSEDLLGVDGFKADFVAIEAAVAVKNVKTAIVLAYVYGAVMGVLMQNGAEVVEVAPITWQSAIGNPNLKTHEKSKLREDHPGRKPSWYQNEGRKLRKQRTLDFAKQYFTIASESDNIGDAVGVAWYAANVLTKKAE